jgi:hypothetical protein
MFACWENRRLFEDPRHRIEGDHRKSFVEPTHQINKMHAFPFQKRAGLRVPTKLRVWPSNLLKWHEFQIDLTLLLGTMKLWRNRYKYQSYKSGLVTKYKPIANSLFVRAETCIWTSYSGMNPMCVLALAPDFASSAWICFHVFEWAIIRRIAATLALAS